jgi:hypothetical protein
MEKQKHKLTICGSFELTTNKTTDVHLMPEFIIEQNHNISNYINMLQLPYSAALNNHMINMVSGIITAEGNKTVSAIYRYYIHRYEGKINDLENAVILICWSKADLCDKPSFILSTDVSLESQIILEYYQNRWDIEVSYRYHKNSLGFDQYQVESLTSINRYWSMVFMTYTFLEFFRASISYPHSHISFMLSCNVALHRYPHVNSGSNNNRRTKY